MSWRSREKQEGEEVIQGVGLSDGEADGGMTGGGGTLALQDEAPLDPFFISNSDSAVWPGSGGRGRSGAVRPGLVSNHCSRNSSCCVAG